jgi:hypothetical protein
MKIIKFSTKVNNQKSKKIADTIEQLDSFLSMSDYIAVRYYLRWIFDRLTPEQVKEYFYPVNWGECLKWLQVFNITGLAESPPKSSARVFYECLCIYVSKNTPIEVLTAFPNLFLLHSGKWEVEGDD